MDLVVEGEGQRSLDGTPISVAAASEGNEEIAAARELARSFLADVQAVHGLPVSGRAVAMVQLVVRELVTNTHKYAPCPYLLTLGVEDGSVQVSVWDSSPVLPAIMQRDPGRVGQHGLEIVTAVCRSFTIDRKPVGKRITAAVVLADDPGEDATDRQP